MQEGGGSQRAKQTNLGFWTQHENLGLLPQKQKKQMAHACFPKKKTNEPQLFAKNKTKKIMAHACF